MHFLVQLINVTQHYGSESDFISSESTSLCTAKQSSKQFLAKSNCLFADQTQQTSIENKMLIGKY